MRKEYYPIHSTLVKTVFVVFLIIFSFNTANALLPYTNDTVVEAPILDINTTVPIYLDNFNDTFDTLYYNFAGYGSQNPINVVGNITGFYLAVSKIGNPSADLHWSLYRFSWNSNVSYYIRDLTALESGSILNTTISNSTISYVKVPFFWTWQNYNNTGYVIKIEQSFNASYAGVYTLYSTYERTNFYNFSNSINFSATTDITNQYDMVIIPRNYPPGQFVGNIYISLTGNYNYPPGGEKPTPTPTATATPTPVPTYIPQNGSQQKCTFGNGNMTCVYTNGTFPGGGNHSYNGSARFQNTSNFTGKGLWNESGNITNIGKTALSNISYTIGNVTQRLSNYNFTNYTNVMTIFVPSILNMLPDELWQVIILGWLFELALIIMGK